MIKKLAIVGGGPRGLCALESIYGCLSKNENPNSLHTLFFERRELPGAGHVYNKEQPDTNWLNVSERGLTIGPRNEIKYEDVVIPSFPSYQEWAGYNPKTNHDPVPDKFPLRSVLGKYLNERYVSIASVLESEGLLQIIHGEVLLTEWKDRDFEIVMKTGATYRADEVVLTIGHQPTKNSAQILDWLAYSKSNCLVDFIPEPYPVENILNSKVIDSKNVVALRGFGLAMIDVMRALTIGLGGKFECIDETTQRMKYIASGKEPYRIVPFSLDGLPMAPKLLNLEIDQCFFPTEKEKKTFKSKVCAIAVSGAAHDNQFLINAITPIISRVFVNLKSKAYNHELNEAALQKIISSWLSDGNFKHHLIVPRNNPAEKTLRAFVEMATGTNAISLDFCVGHVWRHCQPTLYEAISYSNLDDEVIASVVALDERIKRYSYGPPVASLQQLLALIEEDIVTLDFVNNPKIETTEIGWKLSMGENSILVHLMVNSVLNPAKLMEVNSLIVCNLLYESLVEPVHCDLGIETHKNGRVCLSEDEDDIPLAVLGRLSKGTLIGVDAILECFGSRSIAWANGVIERIRTNC